MKNVLAVMVVVMAGISESRSTIIAHWTFETSPPELNNSTTIGGIVAQAGENSGGSTASGLHTSAATDWSNPAGNGSLESFSANTWATGDYFQFQTSLSGYQDVKLTWEQTRSSTGPAAFQLAYSTDGVNFTDFFGTPYTVAEVGWNSVTYANGSSFIADLSAITALDNDGSVFFRLISKVTPSNAAGTSRVDDFMIEATPIPEPAEWGAIACLGLLMMFAIQNWRQRRQAEEAR